LKHSSHSQDVNEDLLSDESIVVPSTKYLTRGTQTKLYAILLPQSPLSEMNKAITETRTSTNVTRTCQVNTLSYLIKTNEYLIQVQYPIEDISSEKQIDRSCTTSFLYSETRSMNELLDQEKLTDIKPSTEINYHQEINVPTIEFEGSELVNDFEVNSSSMPTNEEILLTKELNTTLKCVNACDDVDLNEPGTSVISSVFNNDETQTWKLLDERTKRHYRPINITKVEQVKIFNKVSNNSHVQIIK
jgi:hypothetical protein